MCRGRGHIRPPHRLSDLQKSTFRAVFAPGRALGKQQSANFPVFLPVIREFRPRDWFAVDCVVSQPV